MTPDRTIATEISNASSSERIKRLSRKFYGASLDPVTGVVHVASVGSPSDDHYVVLRIHDTTPQCIEDRFALEFTRARVDAIVLTGRILRDEPRLRYDWSRLGGLGEGLRRWRIDHGLDPTPRLLVLTRGRDVPLDHPVLGGVPDCLPSISQALEIAASPAPPRRCAGIASSNRKTQRFQNLASSRSCNPGHPLDPSRRPVIFTGTAAAADLQSSGHCVDVVGVDRPCIRAAIAYLRGLGNRGISIEAGPTTALDLYRPPREINELVLSVLHQKELDEDTRGAAFLSPSQIAATLGHGSEPFCVETADGSWSFQRFAPTADRDC